VKKLKAKNAEQADYIEQLSDRLQRLSVKDDDDDFEM
jgi:hypothetical protein